MSRALDMILTGRPVPAEEALLSGLANRLVEPGTARAAAESFAREIARFPRTCLRNDRRSAYAQNGLGETEAMRFEMEVGLSRSGGTGPRARPGSPAARAGTARSADAPRTAAHGGATVLLTGGRRAIRP